MMDKGKVKIDQFDDQDFDFWKIPIKDLQYQKNLHQPLLGEKQDSIKKED